MRITAPFLGISLLFLAQTAGANAKSLVFCSEASPENFGPSLATTSTSDTAAARAIYNKLLEFEHGTTNLMPALAESYEISPDGKTYTLNLRKGVKFHTTPYFKPTREFNADDVLFTLERQWKKESPFYKVNGGNYSHFNSLDLNNTLVSVEKKGDHQVVITIKEPLATFVTTLGMNFLSILSAEYGEQLLKAGTPDKIDLDPVGTGPFILVGYQRDVAIRYRANPDYWRSPAKLDTVVFSITPDPSVRLAKLRRNECQMIALPNPADIEDIRRDPNLKMESQEALSIGYVSYNTEKKPFDDSRVRRALNMAVNKQSLLETVYQNAAKIATNPIPSTMWSYNHAVKDDPYDPEGAKKLLAEAGYPNGFETEVWALPVSRPYNPNGRRMAEILQNSYAAIGVKAKIVSYEFGEYLRRGRAGEQQVYELGWGGDTGDPDNFLYEVLSCNAVQTGRNNARWCNAEYTDLVTRARRTSDKAERTKLYEQAQVIFKQEAPWLTVAHAVTFVPMRKEVTGFKIDPLGAFVFYGVDISGQ
jgi:dipeptide transport system substrate-binding protein